ncbi:ankyrin-3-like [Culex pipiens pallens]|uniref:ankyrin-3-like n=1 Tax=Culex pipiens pallens TaxID=42434 RepID=UPI001952DEB6|nr:ankyrin-3-like [Culex pipiens pallens]
MLDDSFAQFNKRNKILAVHNLFNGNESLLSDQERKSVDSYLVEVKDCQDKTGIIIGVTDKVPLFVHQTYAEYFCACFIIEKYSSLNHKTNAFKKLINFLLNNNFIKLKSTQIVQFIQLFLENKNITVDSKYFKAKYLLEKILCINLSGGICSIHNLFIHFIEHSIDESDKNLQLRNIISRATSTQQSQLLLAVCESGCIKVFQLIIDFIDLRKYGFLYLRKAALKGHAKIVRLLVKQNVTDNYLSTTQYIEENDPNFGNTALHLAAQAGNIEVVQILLSNDAIVNIPSVKLHTPLKDAVTFNRLNVVILLLAKNAKIDKELHIASEKGYFKIAELLIKSGANVNARLIDGNTPLIAASGSGHRDIVKLLLDNDALIESATID